MSIPSWTRFCYEFPLTFTFLRCHLHHRIHSRRRLTRTFPVSLMLHLHRSLHYLAVLLRPYLNLCHPTAFQLRCQYPPTPTNAWQVTRHVHCYSVMAKPSRSLPRMSLLHPPPPSQTTSPASTACGMIPACTGIRTLFSGSSATQLLSFIGLLSIHDGEQETGILSKHNLDTGRSVIFFTHLPTSYS